MFANLITIYAEFNTTNVVPGVIEIMNDGFFYLTINKISREFNVRICSENNIHESPYPYKLLETMTFTNASIGDVLTGFMNGVSVTNHTWKYESKTDSVYVYPTTNAFSMTRVGPIAVTNMTLEAFFEIEDILKLKNNGVEFVRKNMGVGFWEYRKLSLEMDESYLQEVLDAITENVCELDSWQITPGHYKDENARSTLSFHEDFHLRKQP